MRLQKGITQRYVELEMSILKYYVHSLVQEEAIKVETIMQNKMREALDEERDSAEKILKETVEKVIFLVFLGLGG